MIHVHRGSYTILKALFACLLLLCLSSSNTNGQDGRPNVLFILADDHTTQAISCYGGHLAEYAQTKNIDELATQGVRLTNCFCTNSICSPSRASILTGQYSHRNGVYLLNQPLPETATTFPQELQKAGYQCGLYGKWHLQSRPNGFDDYEILVGQGRYKDPQFLTPASDDLVVKKGWSTDVIADLTMDFIRSRDKNKPFLAMCHFKATHDPWDSRQPHRSLWENQQLPEPDNLHDDYSNRGAAAKRTTPILERMNQETFPHERLDGATDRQQREFIYQQYVKAFLRCGRVLDQNVGRLMRFLDDEGLSENTIIVYTADQGHFLGEHGFFSKRFMYDESMRMPFIIRHPATLPANHVNADMIANVDFAPTVLDLAGVSVPDSMQGRSFATNLRGNTPDDWPEAVYYHYWQHLLHRNVTAHYGIQTKTDKLIFFYGHPLRMTKFDPTEPEWEYFNLEADPDEMNNLYFAPKSAERVSRLKVDLDALKDQVGDRDSEYPTLAAIHRRSE